MSKLVAFAAIQGGYNIVSQVEGEYKRALDTFDADTKVGFPNTAYYLPVIYSLLGIKVETLEDMQKPLAVARKLLPPHIKGMNHLPYLGPLLDAGLKILVVFFHELSHGLAAIGSGGEIDHIEVVAREGGVCYTRGGSRFRALWLVLVPVWAFIETCPSIAALPGAYSDDRFPQLSHFIATPADDR